MQYIVATNESRNFEFEKRDDAIRCARSQCRDGLRNQAESDVYTLIGNNRELIASYKNIYGRVSKVKIDE